MQEKQWIAHDAYKHFGEMKKTSRATRLHFNRKHLILYSHTFYSSRINELKYLRRTSNYVVLF